MNPSVQKYSTWYWHQMIWISQISIEIDIPIGPQSSPRGSTHRLQHVFEGPQLPSLDHLTTAQAAPRTWWRTWMVGSLIFIQLLVLFQRKNWTKQKQQQKKNKNKQTSSNFGKQTSSNFWCGNGWHPLLKTADKWIFCCASSIIVRFPDDARQMFGRDAPCSLQLGCWLAVANLYSWCGCGKTDNYMLMCSCASKSVHKWPCIYPCIPYVQEMEVSKTYNCKSCHESIAWSPGAKEQSGAICQ